MTTPVNLEQQNQAHFEVSGVSVPLPEGWYFHDEGSSKLSLLYREF